jgi:hypothetical protein
VLRSLIIFKWLRLRVNILMRLRQLRRLLQLWRLQWLQRLWLLPHCIARQNFKKELKFNHLKLSCSFDSVWFILLKIWTEWVVNCYGTFCVIFQFLIMFHNIVGAEAVGVWSGAASSHLALALTKWYASLQLRLRLRNTDLIQCVRKVCSQL